jgi:hypothetical protein
VSHAAGPSGDGAPCDRGLTSRQWLALRLSILGMAVFLVAMLVMV